MNKLRWISLPIACILVWYTTLILGMLIINFSIYFCPKDKMISGMCTASWWDSAEAIIFCFSTGLSAALIVTTAFFIAPVGRVLVAWLTLGIGSMVALYLAFQLSAWDMFASAVCAGLLVTFLLTRSRFAQQGIQQKN